MRIIKKCLNANTLLTALLVAATCPSLSQGTVVFQHLGANDPATEGFTASVAPQAIVGPVIGDSGFDAWSIQGGGPATVFYTGVFSPAEQGLLAGVDWTVSLRIRVVGIPEENPNSFVRVATGTEIFLLAFGSEPDGDPIIRTYDATPFIVDGGGSGYHDYELRYSAQTATADLWLDGVKTLSGVVSLPYTQTLFYWGAGQGDSTWANWNLVSLSVVPEPSALSMLTIGVLLAATRSRRHPKPS